MVIVKLYGRLGNQMFQYAAARSLSYQLGIPLGLDTRYEGAKRYSFQLNQFNIQHESIPDDLIPPNKYSNRLPWCLWKFGLKKPKILNQKGLGFNPIKPKDLKDIYMVGYWQSEKYFRECADIIRSDFTFRIPLIDENLEAYQEILETPSSISLHVRRGDYLENKNLSIHGVCSLGYYKNAVKMIEEHCSNTPRVFVFSDDPDWVSKNLKLPYPVRYIVHNTPENAIEDLRLMTVCRHHVIANSSFSWWGAWLRSNENGKVVSPSKWFVNPNYDNPDIWCDDWLRLQN